MRKPSKKTIVYIAHPIGGAVRANISRVEKILDAMLQKGGIYWPIAPYLDACRYLKDTEENRARAFAVNKLFFTSGFIDQLWVFGRSRGVETEIAWATDEGIDVVFKDFAEVVK